MPQVNTQYLATPQGELILGSHAGQLCLCDWRFRKRREQIDSRIQKALRAGYVETSDEVLQTACRQLQEYFARQRKVFDIPLLMLGTEFQQNVWRELLKIPFGRTASYLELAQAMGKAAAVRAVAAANGANALSILVPCHRIIGSNGSLVGYAGGLRAKADLLRLEFDLFN